ncbi:A33 protein, partial [Hemiprocne comata]|nr:A33 protein [Hemiprocne comata]
AGMADGSQDRSLREELTCVICYDLFSEPVMLDCMHHFCKACIQEYWDSCDHVPICPQCRREFPSRAFRSHYLLAGLVEKVRRSGSAEHQHKMQVSGFCPAGGEEDRHHVSPVQPLQAHHPLLSSQLPCVPRVPRHLCLFLIHSLFLFPSSCLCQTHPLPFPSAQKVSGELNVKIRAEFACLHQILEEEERAVLAELGKKEEQLLARLRRDVQQLEEGMSVLQRDIERIEQALSMVDEVSLLEVSVLGCLFVQLHELQTVTANSLCSSLQVESLDIRYSSAMLDVSTAPAPLTFDPESAHPSLVFSRDLTGVTERNRACAVPSSPRRFLQCVNVLSSQTFDSGRHYWEVWVGSKTKWDLGVAAEDVDRAAKVKLCPENGYWTLRLRNRTEYWATTTPWVRLTPRRPPRKVGIFLDCQEGIVAFFDAGDMSHLFTFHQVSAERYCPFFSTCFSDGRENMAPMYLCHLTL